MKNIIVFTDHSTQSAHAARYAVQLAKKIKANILLADIVSINSKVLVSHEEFNETLDDELPIENDRVLNLRSLLENELAENTLPGKFLPAIYCQSDILPVIEQVENVDIALIVLAANLYYGVSSIMPGEICGEILASFKFPLLIVPDGAPIRYAEKYAYMADITCENVPTITKVAKLADYSAAEVMLVNINNGRPLDADQEHAVKLIMKEIVHQVDYGRIYYRHLSNSVLKSDVEWLFQDNKFEMLAMAYNPDSIHNQVLRFDYTDKMIGNINVPLLIYPSND